MKLASARSESQDGSLMVVSRDLTRMAPARHIARSLREALEQRKDSWPALIELYDDLNADRCTEAARYDPSTLGAPLPRAWQWLDASAFPSHGALMQKALNIAPIATSAPLMYQGMSHRFLGPTDPVAFPDERDDIDFEAEFAVITDAVPMGVDAESALGHVLLAVLVNDWSLRAIAPIEMKTGFGWIQAKPACSMGPIAVTLDELGDVWSAGRIQATMCVMRGSETFGMVPATEMAYGFHELIMHAARTRELCAGTIVGSGTVSSVNYAQVGSCCIAERRAIEMITEGKPRTPFLRFGERIRMKAVVETSPVSPFGETDQSVAPPAPSGAAQYEDA